MAGEAILWCVLAFVGLIGGCGGKEALPGQNKDTLVITLEAVGGDAI